MIDAVKPTPPRPSHRDGDETPGGATHRIDIAVDHPAFDGHFPGHPMLPGVALLAEVIECVMADAELSAWVGAVPQASVVKFLHPVGPGAALQVQFVRSVRALKFSVQSADGTFEAASGQFELASTSTSTSPSPSPTPTPSP